MNSESYHSEDAEFSEPWYKKWFGTVTKRKLILPLPLGIVRERLISAFASPITVSKGFLFSSIKCIGQMEGNNLNVKYTSYGRGIMSFRMQGELFDDPRGSRMEMTIRNETPLYLIFGLVLVGALLIAKGHISVGFLFAIIFFDLLTFPVMAWHRNVAANSISNLLLKIVGNLPPGS